MEKIDYGLVATVVYNIWEESDIETIEELLNLLGEMDSSEV